MKSPGLMCLLAAGWLALAAAGCGQNAAEQNQGRQAASGPQPRQAVSSAPEPLRQEENPSEPKRPASQEQPPRPSAETPRTGQEPNPQAAPDNRPDTSAPRQTGDSTNPAAGKSSATAEAKAPKQSESEKPGPEKTPPAQATSARRRGLPPPPEARRSPPRRGSDGVWEITFDTLKFPIEKDQPFRRELLTTQIWDLVGKKVRIRGYMLPTFKQTGLTEFVLVRDNMECCFGPGAALYDCAMVYMVPGKTADFSIRPVTVTGTFTVEEFRDFEDVVRAVFRIDAVEVRH